MKTIPKKIEIINKILAQQKDLQAVKMWNENIDFTFELSNWWENQELYKNPDKLTFKNIIFNSFIKPPFTKWNRPFFSPWFLYWTVSMMPISELKKTLYSLALNWDYWDNLGVDYFFIFKFSGLLSGSIICMSIIWELYNSEIYQYEKYECNIDYEENIFNTV